LHNIPEGYYVEIHFYEGTNISDVCRGGGSLLLVSNYNILKIMILSIMFIGVLMYVYTHKIELKKLKNLCYIRHCVKYDDILNTTF